MGFTGEAMSASSICRAPGSYGAFSRFSTIDTVPSALRTISTASRFSVCVQPMSVSAA